MSVVIYGKTGCPYTQAAMRDHAGAEYRDVLENQLYLREMLDYSRGVRKVPVIVKDGKATVGYNGS